MVGVGNMNDFGNYFVARDIIRVGYAKDTQVGAGIAIVAEVGDVYVAIVVGRQVFPIGIGESGNGEGAPYCSK